VLVIVPFDNLSNFLYMSGVDISLMLTVVCV